MNRSNPFNIIILITHAMNYDDLKYLIFFGCMSVQQNHDHENWINAEFEKW